jgi:hypothetical protein
MQLIEQPELEPAREQETMRRLVYLLQPNLQGLSDNMRMVAFLLNYVFEPDKADLKRFSYRVRALRLVFAMATSEQIEKVFERPISELKSHLKYCEYMVVFEELRLPHTLEQLEKCDKAGLINGLWKDFRSEPRVVLLVARLVQDFHINEAKIVLALISQMNRLSLHSDALRLVDVFVVEPFLESGALNSHFVNAVEALTAKSQGGLLEALHLIRSIVVKMPAMAVEDYVRVVLAVSTINKDLARDLADAVIDKTKRTLVIEKCAF